MIKLVVAGLRKWHGLSTPPPQINVKNASSENFFKKLKKSYDHTRLQEKVIKVRTHTLMHLLHWKSKYSELN